MFFSRLWVFVGCRGSPSSYDLSGLEHECKHYKKGAPNLASKHRLSLWGQLLLESLCAGSLIRRTFSCCRRGQKEFRGQCLKQWLVVCPA